MNTGSKAAAPVVKSLYAAAASQFLKVKAERFRFLQDLLGEGLGIQFQAGEKIKESGGREEDKM